MISLDNKILDSNSMVAKRMVDYGVYDRLYIIVPNTIDKFVELSPEVKVWGIGGNKIKQFIKLKKKGEIIIKKYVIDLITTQDPFFTGLLGLILKKKTKINLEIQLHGDFFGNSYYKKSGFKNFIQYFLAKYIVLYNADKIRVVGERIKNNLLELGVNEDKIELRAIEVNKEYIESYQIKTDLKKKYSAYNKIFLSIGRLELVKNIDFLIDIFAEVIKEKKDYLLLVVGSGSQKNILIEKVKMLGLENNIKFEDWTDDHISYIKTCDVVLFPSLSEGYGMVPMEANMAGKKVIMSDVGVANYELKPSENVIILPIDYKERFINEIKKYE